MIKQQGYDELELHEGETLTQALLKLNENTRRESEAQYVEIHQVVPHGNQRFTVILNVYK
ncbi:MULTISPECIES: hypothetical protein [Bacillus]|uniref:Uncharacterized protein n=1 Tax=Bacillus rhizoplanae TaxID=2880966 RepID=A0ABN7ZZV2_9BACI|nr:hypothetical protein [Bacillus rhizoplanae]CAG9613757.1 hypothetical protein BACCIP111899_02976 [Bacillus rhizoplanae]